MHPTETDPLIDHGDAAPNTANGHRARRHAIALERLAVSILTFGIVMAVLTTAAAPQLVWVAFTGALVGAAA